MGILLSYPIKERIARAALLPRRGPPAKGHAGSWRPLIWMVVSVRVREVHRLLFHMAMEGWAKGRLEQERGMPEVMPAQDSAVAVGLGADFPGLVDAEGVVVLAAPHPAGQTPPPNWMPRTRDAGTPSG